MPIIAPDKLTAEIEILLRHAADHIVMPRYRQLSSEQIIEKEPGELVTVADREVEQYLTGELTRLLPDTCFLGEETVSQGGTMPENCDEGRWWIVDPIDGTHNFASGKPPFAIMIALASDGDLAGSWIFDPVAGRLCHALRSEGAFINHEPVKARSSGKTLLQAGISTLYMGTEEAEYIEKTCAGKAKLLPIPRCAGEQYPRVASGQNDFALFNRVLPWDHAPGALFLKEAGGKVCRLNGDPYRFYEQKNGLIAASSTEICDQALALLKDFENYGD